MGVQRNSYLAAVCAGLLFFSLAHATQAVSGALDPTFGLGGVAVADLGGYDNGYKLAVQPDGKIVVAGSASVPGAVAFGLARLKPDGTLDTSFGNGGKVFVNLFGYSVTFGDIALQPDGKIVVGGYAGVTATSLDYDLWLVRFNSNGTYDTSFGQGGLVTTDLFAHSFDVLNALAVQPDGRILAAGMVRKTNDDADYTVLRYLPDGSLDPQFGTGGKAVTDVTGEDDVIYGLALQPDGKIVATGFAVGREYAVVRYDGAGHPDPGFGTGGIAMPDSYRLPAVPFAIGVQPDGNIVAAGIGFPRTDSDFVLWRLLANGQPDTGFGTGGRVLTDFSGRSEQIHALVLQDDGGIVAVGYTQVSGQFHTSDFAVARYLSDGTLDPAFGTAGQVVDDFFGDDDYAMDAAGLPDGRFLVTGWVLGAPETPRDARVVRYLGPQLANQPPTISGAAASPDTLWPANHKMIDVTIPYTVTDDHDPAAAVQCSLSVASNEPVNGTGDGDTAPDWQILDQHHLRLRAERAGNGNGRIYTVTITCQDTAGAASNQTVTVRVPKSQGKK
jgi:uncharacterized delta-60 repeat protein